MKRIALVVVSAVPGLLTACLVPSAETDGGPADRPVATDGANRTDAASRRDGQAPLDHMPPPPFDAQQPDRGPRDAGPDCDDGGPCPEGYYCDRNNCTESGRCELLPGSWTCMMQGSDPQCGCDGVTYGNGCALAFANAALAHAGECDAGIPDATRPDIEGAPCTGPLARACGQQQFCDYRGCLTSSTTACTTVPTSCPATSAPVCGCDGRTYENDCLRQQSGFGLDHEGACTGSPESCSASAPCALDGVCDIRSCASDATGICVPPPSLCMALSQPVCTCAGRTYTSVCELLVVGGTQSIDYAGACR